MILDSCTGAAQKEFLVKTAEVVHGTIDVTRVKSFPDFFTPVSIPFTINPAGYVPVLGIHLEEKYLFIDAIIVGLN
jgi:hypothetical protein